MNHEPCKVPAHGHADRREAPLCGRFNEAVSQSAAHLFGREFGGVACDPHEPFSCNVHGSGSGHHVQSWGAHLSVLLLTSCSTHPWEGMDPALASPIRELCFRNSFLHG